MVTFLTQIAFNNVLSPTHPRLVDRAIHRMMHPFYTVYVHFLTTVGARCTQIISVSVDEALGTSAVLIASKEPQMLLRRV